jgi:nicotinate-nucleotide--dimethylbenzimidazole phosphoribosyltransferase
MSPFDDIRAMLAALPRPGGAPPGDPSLGALEGLAAELRAWRRSGRLNRPICALYAGSSGGDPAGVRAALEGLASGQGPAAVIAQSTGAGLEAFDLAIDRPIPDAAQAAAMSERECAATMAFGMEALAKQPDLLMPAVLGDDGGAGARDVLAALAGERTDRTARALDEAGDDPLQLLRQLGTRQMAAVAGAIAAARVQKIPVLLDGGGAYAAAAVLQAVEPSALDHCIAAACRNDEEAALLRRLRLTPVLQMDLPAEGGVAALVALGVLQAAAVL